MTHPGEKILVRRTRAISPYYDESVPCATVEGSLPIAGGAEAGLPRGDRNVLLAAQGLCILGAIYGRETISGGA